MLGMISIWSLLLLLGFELLSEGFWHLWWWWTWQMEGDLDTIVDEPLEGGKSTDHDDTGNQTLPDTLWTQFLQD